MYSFVLFIVFNHCVSELGSHEKVLYRKEDVAREKTQFFQKTVFLGKKHGKKRFFPGDSKFPLFWNPTNIALPPSEGYDYVLGGCGLPITDPLLLRSSAMTMQPSQCIICVKINFVPLIYIYIYIYI